MNGIEFLQHLLWGIVLALAAGLGAWTLGTAFQKALKSKIFLTMFRILALLVIILACFVYFPKWF